MARGQRNGCDRGLRLDAPDHTGAVAGRAGLGAHASYGQIAKRAGGYELREMAKGKGQRMNLKVYRLYREESLAVRRRRGRKRALGMRAPLNQASRSDEIWVLDCGIPSHTLLSWKVSNVSAISPRGFRSC